jgi:hypothetical protein
MTRDTCTLNPDECKAVLRRWHSQLLAWLTWLDANEQALSGENAPREIAKTFTLLKQNLSLLMPWMKGLAMALPCEIPANVEVKKCESERPDFVTWRQRLTNDRPLASAKPEDISL